METTRTKPSVTIGKKEERVGEENEEGEWNERVYYVTWKNDRIIRDNMTLTENFDSSILSLVNHIIVDSFFY